MKLKNHLFSAAIAFAIALPSANLSADIIFQADFDGSTEISGALTNNASDANLNAGTAIGSWSGGSGAIIDNAASDNNAYVIDDVIGSAADNPIALFTQSVDLAAGDTLTVTFDIFSTRQGNNGLDNDAGGRQMQFAFGDGTNTSQNLVFRQTIFPKFFDNDTSQANGEFTSNGGGNSGFQNAADGNYLGWGTGVPHAVTIDFSSTGALLSVDWNSDGNVTSSGSLAGFDASVPISQFDISFLNVGARGAYLDNVVADATFAAVPEPGSMSIVGSLGLLALIRRKRK